MRKKVLLVAVSTIKKKLLPTKKQILDEKRWKQFNNSKVDDEDNEKAMILIPILILSGQ